MSEYPEISVDLNEYTEIEGTVVLGGGAVGTATACAFAEKNHPQGKATVVIEFGPDTIFRKERSSQGNLRGSRTVDQSLELGKSIRATWQFMDMLQETVGKALGFNKQGRSISKQASPENPYLMVVKDLHHAQMMPAILNHRGSHHQVLTPEKVKQRYGLNLPRDYNGVLNSLESRTLDLDAYFDAMQEYLRQKNGQVSFENEIVDYGKLKNGKHLLELKKPIELNGKLSNKFIVDDLVVATGIDINHSLDGLKIWHDNHHASQPELFEAPKEIPERFHHENCISVPQRTAHLYFDLPPGMTAPKPATVYNLDVDHEFKLSDGTTEKYTGVLGFYMFPDIVDGKPGIKVGYDPVNNTSDPAKLAAQFKMQEELMLNHVSKMYGVARQHIHVAQVHTCKYPLDVVHYPCMGQSKQFHGIYTAAGFGGYGVMATQGAASQMLNNLIAAGSRYDPDYKATPREKEVFKFYYGPSHKIPSPPSAQWDYDAKTYEYTPAIAI